MLTSRKLLHELRVQGARTDRVLDELRAQREEMRADRDEMRADREEMRADREQEKARWEKRDTELQEVLRFNAEAFRRSELAFADFRAEQREMREDIRAHTRAILALIDRIEGGGTAPAV